MTSRVLENFEAAVALREPEQVPVCIWSVALWYLVQNGINVRDYYQGLDLKLNTQVACQDEYPETIMLPGIWPDFGVAAEPSAFGCEVVWKEGEAPNARPALTTARQILSMKPVNVLSAGLFPKILETYAYFFRHLDKRYIEDYGYLKGMVFFLGPLETAALVRGYTDFLLDLIENPKMVHMLLKIITDTLLEWFNYLETNVIGPMKRLIMADHFPTMISADHFEEFVFPYYKQIFDAYPNALKLYHNEGQITRILQHIPKFGTDVFHFGTEAMKTKELIGDKVCLLGNLDPVRIMQNGTAQTVTDEALKVLEAAAPGGGFILCAAGAYGVGTPRENIRALLESVNLFHKKKTPKLAPPADGNDPNGSS
jgi:uroporphyrinogen decarboxylase